MILRYRERLHRWQEEVKNLDPNRSGGYYLV